MNTRREPYDRNTIPFLARHACRPPCVVVMSSSRPRTPCQRPRGNRSRLRASHMALIAGEPSYRRSAEQPSYRRQASLRQVSRAIVGTESLSASQSGMPGIWPADQVSAFLPSVARLACRQRSAVNPEGYASAPSKYRAAYSGDRACCD
jgi:hypothetical protein